MTGIRIAEGILAVHLLIIGFNIAGLVVIPLGGALRWRFVRIAWLRLLHLALLAVVVGQALAGRVCILTLWQSRLGGQTPQPLIMTWIDRLIYWPLPFWVFTVIYALAFCYVVALCLLVPFGPRHYAANG